MLRLVCSIKSAAINTYLLAALFYLGTASPAHSTFPPWSLEHAVNQAELFGARHNLVK